MQASGIFLEQEYGLAGTGVFHGIILWKQGS